VLIFPSGVFIALGCARLLSWTRSITLAVLSFACLIGFGMLMAGLESRGASALSRTFAVDAGMLMLFTWSFVIYRIGKNASYWSPTVLRAWRRASWFGIAVLCLIIVGLALEIALARMVHS